MAGRTGDDLALYEHDGLRPHRLGASDEIGRRPTRPERDLYQAVAIAEIEKDDSSEVAAAVDPAPQPNPLPPRARSASAPQRSGGFAEVV